MKLLPVFLALFFSSIQLLCASADEFLQIETSISAEIYHAEREFLLASSCYNVALHALSGDWADDRKKQAIKRLIEIDAGVLNQKKELLTKISTAMPKGARLYIFEKKTDVRRERGYVAILEGEVVGRWLEDWARVNKDGSLTSEPEK